MDWVSWFLQWLAGIIQFVIGIVLGTVITGVFTWKVVLPKIMKNKDVQDTIKTLKDVKETIENFSKSEDWQDMVTLFHEGKELLKKVVENQKELRGKK